MSKTTLLLAIGFFLSFMPTAYAQVDGAFDSSMLTPAYDYQVDPENMTLEEAVDYIRMLYPTANTGLHRSFTARGANCNAFIKPNGDFGPHGKVIATAFDKNPRLTNLLDNDAATARGIRTLCPNFRSFDREERVRFWVWTFAAIAWDESTCIPGASNPNGTTTRAVGYLQMEDGLKYRSWRGGYCTAKSVRPAASNLLCGMEIMSAHFDGEYESPKRGCVGENARGLILSCSYWHKLRSITSPIARLVALYPGCGSVKKMKRS